MTEVIPAEEVTILGVLSGRQYARLRDGQEVAIEREIQPWEQDNKIPPHKLVITKTELFKTNEDGVSRASHPPVPRQPGGGWDVRAEAGGRTNGGAASGSPGSRGAASG